MYDYGQGVPQDYVAAAKWYLMAAEQGVAKAQRDIGRLYAIGQGVPQDYVLAHVWTNLAASQGYADAQERRDLIELLMTPAQIAEAQKLAREWRPK